MQGMESLPQASYKPSLGLHTSITWYMLSIWLTVHHSLQKVRILIWNYEILSLLLENFLHKNSTFYHQRLVMFYKVHTSNFFFYLRQKANTANARHTSNFCCTYKKLHLRLWTCKVEAPYHDNDLILTLIISPQSGWQWIWSCLAFHMGGFRDGGWQFLTFGRCH